MSLVFIISIILLGLVCGSVGALIVLSKRLFPIEDHHDDVYAWTPSDPVDVLTLACMSIITTARNTGYVVTIEVQPRPGTPLAMGNYEMVFDVRPARVGGKYGGPAA